jgi:large subunit ribosomal protein LP0
MNIMPFFYGMEIRNIYDDGQVLDKSILDFDPASLIKKFQEGVSNITALSLETGYITKSAVPHMIMNAFKNVAALAVETDYKLAALDAAMAAGSQQQAATSGAAKVEE